MDVFKIAVVSGKGGTGKTTVSVSLMHSIDQLVKATVHLIDCDVEEPNDALFFPEKKMITSKPVYQEIPFINNDLCAYCRKCSEFCAYNAIVVIPDLKYAEVESSLCHSCGACMFACKFGAIEMQRNLLGRLNHYLLSPTTFLSDGELSVGSTMQTMLIKTLKEKTELRSRIIIYDAPPGTSCSVVQTVSDVDLVVVVTEPTPFGVHDMQLMIELLNEMDKPYGVVVNKAGMGSEEVFQVLKQEEVELFGTIPFDTTYASGYASGNLLGNNFNNMSEWYRKITDRIMTYVPAYEGTNRFKW